MAASITKVDDNINNRNKQNGIRGPVRIPCGGYNRIIEDSSFKVEESRTTEFNLELEGNINVNNNDMDCDIQTKATLEIEEGTKASKELQKIMSKGDSMTKEEKETSIVLPINISAHLVSAEFGLKDTDAESDSPQANTTVSNDDYKKDVLKESIGNMFNNFQGAVHSGHEKAKENNKEKLSLE